MNTVAYWMIEKRAHSSRLRAQINQIAQVVIDLSVKRGKTALTLIKAEKRHLPSPNTPYNYWAKDMQVSFEAEAHPVSRIDVGSRLKELRTRQGVVSERSGQTCRCYCLHHFPGGRRSDLSVLQIFRTVRRQAP